MMDIKNMLLNTVTIKSFCKIFLFLSVSLGLACGQKPRSWNNETFAVANPIDYVDPFIGTGFHGHTYPGASAPFGAVQLSPDTRFGNWDAASGYHYTDSTIIGFSHTHLSGTGVSDLADILFHPTTKGIREPDANGYIYDFLKFSHDDEEASPGYYAVNFKEEGIKAEMTATTYAGMHRYSFEPGKEQNLIIDMAHLLTDEVIDSVEIRQSGENEISGMRRTQGWTPNQYVFFVARFSKDFLEVEHIDDGEVLEKEKKPESDKQQVFIRFGESDGEPVVAKVGLSIVSEENARLNLEHSVSDFDFEGTYRKVKEEWEKELSQIVVEGGTEEALKNFYTSVYHSKLVPNINSDSNGDYRRHDMKIDKMPDGHHYYSTFSLWDTFRAWNPLQTLIDTDLVNDMIRSFLIMYEATGEMPIWPLSAGETRTMIGYHTASVIADAYVKGIRDYDGQAALEALKVSSNINKKGSDYYVKYGFIPANIKKESVSSALEYAYDDWCIAEIAKRLNDETTAGDYYKRGLNYVNVFDGHTRFFRGKRLDGNWERGFNPFEPGRAYTEATAWQYRFFAPHDVNGMIQLFGGRDEFITHLDSLFTVESDIHGEMQDITGLIGQYAHGNEPSHHMAYLYNYVGQPWKTQEMTRRILDEMYQATPEGISGNEDAGQISAWYILSSLGLYAVNPGTTEFNLTTPLFEKATLQLANGKTLEITATNPSKNRYIDKVEWNGKEITANYIKYEDLMEGGHLRFSLTNAPNTSRGIKEEDYPYSYTEGEVVSIPYTTKDLALFEDAIQVDLGTATENAEIYYTLDGKEPDQNSTKYTDPFEVTGNITIKAKAFKEGYKESRTFTLEATKADFLPSVKASANQNGVNYSYYEGYYQSVEEIKSTPVISRGVLDEPSIDKARQEDHFAFIYTGVIDIPEDGVYEFMTRSDDGSVLYIQDEKVVDNDGSHAPIIANGRIALKKGYHPYTLLYFEDYEGQHLEWGWRKPGESDFTKIPTENLYLK